MNWMTLVLFVALPWICQGKCQIERNCKIKNLRDCLLKKPYPYLVVDNFNGVITGRSHWNHVDDACIVFLKKNQGTQRKWINVWPQIQEKDGAYQLYITKWHVSKKLRLYVLQGRQCNTTIPRLNGLAQDFNHTVNGSCQVRYLQTGTICLQSTYDENFCNRAVPEVNDKYIINITRTDKNCLSCDDPVKEPEKEYGVDELKEFDVTFEITEGEDLDPVQAAGVMLRMSDIASSINVSSAALTVGEGVTGILVREQEPEDINQVSFAYKSPNDSIRIIENTESESDFSRSITVSKEAFEQALSLNVSVPFAAVFRFYNMAKDEKNSTVLNNEVLAVEMGTIITNLTDKISINFWNMNYEGTPSCQSWNGEGSRPNWTGDGCLTIENGENITCQCSHLTFFAILMTPPNQTISSSDLHNLTVITQVGCGLSMFFLSIVLFMHLLMRKTKASKATRILIHLVSAMFLLNFTFLINNFVAKLKSAVGCKIMAALMHYFMLATFTWFAVQAFHLCLQLYVGGKIVIRHYILKVCITSWVLPSIVGIVLLVIGKYGEQIIHVSDTEEDLAMCWIIDSDVHYIVNIGYYALIFIFTFSTFIVIVSWLCCLKRSKAANVQISRNGRSIVTILGLCCMLGITWGFAFFAYGVLLVPSYYVFTVLNSFQGFFLFIYYYNTRQAGEISGGVSSQNIFNSSSSISTLKTNLDSSENPYVSK